ncbi:MAG: biopolymer transporter ExbD [Ruminococcus sp.]|nr:biopolymer transporter ExbD [Ruminococcus sp.]
MNKREIILDFTSLLDVIMIILFFFILFSHYETIQAIEEKEKMQTEYNQLMEDAEDLLTSAEMKNIQADELLSEAQQAGKRNAYNIKSIIEFSKGTNLRLNLNMNSMSTDVFCGDDFIGSISGDTPESMSRKFADIIEQKGYTKDDTILCVFVYDASENGTNSAYKSVKEMFEILKKDYQHFFCSDVDISIERE